MNVRSAAPDSADPHRPIVSLTGVGKRFVKFDDAPLLATAALRFRTRTRRSDLWALRGIEFAVERGECVGVIGRNGAGKSTLLQLLAGVTAPTEGTVRVSGSVAPLISVGVGFHPELTGRENVYVNGTILGMTRRSIDRRFDDIVGFAELEAFIDTPVKFYSSGMFVRLGFSVAVQAEPDVLLVDEVLAVGDLAFQVKSFEQMNRIRAQGTTILVVTHNLGAVRTLCPRTVLVNQGEIAFDGPTDEAISRFHDVLGSVEFADTSRPGEARTETAVAEVTGFELLGPDGTATAYAAADAEVTVRVHVRARQRIDEPFLGLIVGSPTGVAVYADSNLFTPLPPLQAGATATYDIALRLALATGSYVLRATLNRRDAAGSPVRLDRAGPLLVYVAGRGMVMGLADLGARFPDAARAE